MEMKILGDNFTSVVESCDCCNIVCEPWNVRKYEVLFEQSKIHGQNQITLCHVCFKIAKYAEQFFCNLQSSYEHKQDAKPAPTPIINLSIFNLGPIEISGTDDSDSVERYSISSAVNGKLEIVLETDVKLEESLNEPDISDDDYSEVGLSAVNGKLETVTETDVKLEESLNEPDISFDNNCPEAVSDPSCASIKQGRIEESGLKFNKVMKLEKSLTKGVKRKIEPKRKTKESVSKESVSKKSPSNNDQSSKVKVPVVHLTLEEFIQEKIDKSKNRNYINSQYRCTDCVLGFSHKFSYLKHMERHSESAGQFICDLCKQHFAMKSKLKYHIYSHQIRYKCIHCNILRSQKCTIRDHVISVHNASGHPKAKCPICNKIYTRQSSLRKHMVLKHKRPSTERVLCPFCKKTYSSAESLKNHMILKHPEEVAPVKKEKKHVCQECGAKFRNAAYLRIHKLKHSDKRDFYCVECDKAFKSETSLKTHLKYTLIHVSRLELPFACEHCDQRFPINRSLLRHVNSTHLKIRPFSCDQCSRSYCDPNALRTHKRIFHEGYKLPLKYQCDLCDKAFAHKQILNDHVRTHTGERPFQCDKCEASFSQSGTLSTHKKLVHLRLPRNVKRK